MSILILSGLKDIEIDAISVRLNERNADFFRLNTYTIEQENFSFSFINNQFEASIPFDLKKVDTIWNRIPINIRGIVNKNDPPEKVFLAEETFWFLHNIGSLLPNVRWINHPVQEEFAHCKLNQLQEAQKIGIKLPKTILSNSTKEIQDFYKENNKNIVYKPIFHSGQITTGDSLAVYTSLVADEQIKNIDSIKECPGFFQEFIKKEYDIRVIIIGNRVFPVRIHSQKHQDSQVDWRKAPFDELDCELITLPNDIETKCISLVKNLGILTAAMDIVETKDGELYFLEVNPGGRWLQFSVRTVQPIAEALTDLLLNENQ